MFDCDIEAIILTRWPSSSHYSLVPVIGLHVAYTKDKLKGPCNRPEYLGMPIEERYGL
jgi:hypothetical protein